jgi:hypothetical protein
VKFFGEHGTIENDKEAPTTHHPRTFYVGRTSPFHSTASPKAGLVPKVAGSAHSFVQDRTPLEIVVPPLLLALARGAL